MSDSMPAKRTSDALEVELTRPPSDQWARPINYRDGDGSRAADPGSDNRATGADRERTRGRPGIRTRRSAGSGGFGIRSRSGTGSGSRAEGRDGYVVALTRAMAEYPDDLRELVEDYLKQLR